MIRQTMKVLAVIGVLLHFVAAADQVREANQRRNRKIPLSEQFVRSLSVIKGSDRRALQPKNMDSNTPRLAAAGTQRVAGLSRRMQKQRTMQRRKPRFRRGRARISSGGRGVGHGKWRPAGWNGSNGRHRNGNWRNGREPNKPTNSWKAPNNLGWGSPWGQGWGGSAHKPANKPSKRE